MTNCYLDKPDHPLLSTKTNYVCYVLGAWAYDNDYSKYCTTAGNLAISSILTGMKADGTYNTMVDAAFAASTEV